MNSWVLVSKTMLYKMGGKESLRIASSVEEERLALVGMSLGRSAACGIKTRESNPYSKPAWQRS